MDVPFSSLASREAKRAFIETMTRTAPSCGDPIAGIPKIRAGTSAAFKPLIGKSAALYPVTITPKWIDGVYIDIVVPKGGVPRRDRNRVLIILPGGGLFTSAREGGRLEAIPIAGLGGFKVVTVDYRQGPEHKFPAASEDVATVYRALLKRYPAKNIGLYGSSAGGILTAEAVAWLQSGACPGQAPSA